MDNSLFNDLKKDFGNVKWVDQNLKGITKQGWFLLEINPVPVQEEINLVASDIIEGRTVGVTGGKLSHWNECGNAKHYIGSKIIRKALKNLKQQTYFVAVYTGEVGFKGLKNQPIAIVLDPEITYINFPDHPHLNGSIFDPFNRFFFPNSLCYTDSPEDLGSNEKERILNAFDQISMWLFRHQVWVETRKYIEGGIWIGPEAAPLPPYEYPGMLNPNGKCRCGSNKSYSACHRTQDLTELAKMKAAYERKTLDQAKMSLLPYMSNGFSNWKATVETPTVKSLNKLKSILL